VPSRRRAFKVGEGTAMVRQREAVANECYRHGYQMLLSMKEVS